MNTPEELRAEGEALIAAGKAKIAAAERAQAIAGQVKTETPTPPSEPMTVIPERKPKGEGRFTASQICGQPISEAEINKLLKKKDGE